MSLSRRSFVHTMGAGAAGLWIGSRGREASLFETEALLAQGATPSVILSSNENPLGCHPEVLSAVRGALSEAGRYAFATADEVTALVAKDRKSVV